MERVKRVFVILIALSGLTIACDIKDTPPPKVWRRGVEPWLSGNRQWEQCTAETVKEGQLIPAVQCGPTVKYSKKPCPDFITRDEEALELLVEPRDCMDEIIRSLTRFAATRPEALSDVAAAYYVRAQREDNPSHLLHALYAADQAVAANPESKPGRFNLALIQEALQFRSQALESWERFLVLDARSQWASEARTHRDRLKPLVAYNVRERWEATKVQLKAAIRARDDGTVRELINDFPSAAYDWLRHDLSKMRLDDAQVLAKALSERLGGDPDPLERVANPTDSLPLRLWTMGHAASEMSRLNQQHVDALALLDSIAPQARPYGYLTAVLDSWRGFVLTNAARYPEGLTAYRSAERIFKRLNDRERRASIHTRIGGVYTVTGAAERAWRELLQAARLAHHIREVNQQHAFLGEAGRAAAAFGYPQLAMIYQSAASDELLARQEGTTGEERQQVLMNLAIALRERAKLEVRLGRSDAARTNLEHAARIAREHSVEQVRRSLEVRRAEVRAQALVKSSPGEAVKAFAHAIRVADDESLTYRAELHSQRASAHLALNDTVAALNDLDTAFALLRKEQENILARRTRDQAAEIWSAYFSRFRETYDLLIQTATKGARQPNVAFSYNERARAAEPLNLLQQFDLLPSDLRRRYENNDLGLPYIQASLPIGTYILQYAVLKEQTYVWILSREITLAVTLPTTRQDVTDWTRILQRAAANTNDAAFERNLAAPYGGLFDYVLRTVQSLHREHSLPRIVIVPDGPMHGLPFAALWNANKKRYFVHEAVIEVAGSTALYLVSLERDRALASATPSLLLVGNPLMGDDLMSTYDLDNLPHAEAEVTDIADQYGLERPVARHKATPAHFLSQAPAHSIIHFAGHAIVNAQAPYRSFLALAEHGSDTGELDAQELLTQIKLDRTRLVILSSCRSAGGAPVGLEGVAPLVRPFIGTGVPAVIGSLWDVDDATTRDLMVSFHTRYRKGDDAAAALQAAQLAMLGDSDDPGNRPALAWGSFQVIGHASSPFKPSAPMKKEIPP
jgi:CHAT domain-containing protein